MVSKFYSKINRKDLFTVWFFVWGRVNRVGWDRLFFKVWIHFICKSYQALYLLQKYPKGSCILCNGLLRIYFGLCCQHMWKETNMFTICILSWIKQIPGDNTQKDSCYSGCPSMSSSNSASFTVRSQGHNFPSQRLVVYSGQMHLQPTVPWTKLFIRFSTTITIQ